MLIKIKCLFVNMFKFCISLKVVVIDLLVVKIGISFLFIVFVLVLLVLFNKVLKSFIIYFYIDVNLMCYWIWCVKGFGLFSVNFWLKFIWSFLSILEVVLFIINLVIVCLFMLCVILLIVVIVVWLIGLWVIFFIKELLILM